MVLLIWDAQMGILGILVLRIQTMTNTEIVKGMYEAFGRGDTAAVLNSLADNVDWLVPGPISISVCRPVP